MKKFLINLSVLSLCLIASSATTKIGALVKSPDKFDGKTVTAAGVVAKFQARTSKIGNKYFTFELKEGSDSLNVYGRGELKKAPTNGAKVQVSGKFEKDHKLKSFSVKNQVTVASERDIVILHK